MRIRDYKRLIRKLPKENQFLLLYTLDLLGIFDKASEKNLMNAASECKHAAQLTAAQTLRLFSSLGYSPTPDMKCARERAPCLETLSSFS